MKLRTPVIITSVIFALFCSGCVKNQLLRSEAHVFSAKAIEATESGEAFYISLVRSNQQLHELLYTLDGRCVPASMRPKERISTTPASIEPGVSNFCLKLNSDLSYSSFEREFRSLDFVASYVTALAEAAAEPELISAKTFTQASTDFNTLRASLKQSGIEEDKLNAVSELLKEIETISKYESSAK